MGIGKRYGFSRLFFFGLSLGIGLLSGGCAPPASPVEATRTPDWLLTPFETATPEPPSPGVTPTVLRVSTPPLLALPTPTPIIYTVKSGDTLIGIAVRYGLTLDELLAANPGVDPQFLRVDADLVIPFGKDQPQPEVAGTPVEVEPVRPSPDCYFGGQGETWCFFEVQNNQARPVENISALLTLSDQNGKAITTTLAAPLINLLPAQGRIPLVATFQNLPQIPLYPSAQVRTALFVGEGEVRYLSAKVDLQQENISSDGSQVEVVGEVTLTEGAGDPPAAIVWVAVAAYGENDRVVGVRRWEMDAENPSGAPIPFRVVVYSLGPAISKVRVHVEARP